MIGVDTNVLLRLFVRDDDAQHELARSWFHGRTPADPAFVCMIVAMEFVWSLRRTYRYRREDVDRLVSGLLDADDVCFERPDVVAEAIRLASQGRGDLPDIMVALTNLAAGCLSTVTFDRHATRTIPSMELLT